MKTMKILTENLANIIKVKTLVTLALTAVFCALAVSGEMPEEFMAVYTMVIGFYFGTQHEKQTTPGQTKNAAAPLQVLPGIDVDDLGSHQLRAVLLQMGREPAENATREELLAMLDTEAAVQS